MSAWSEPEVHAWSGRMSEVLKKELPSLPSDSLLALTRANAVVEKAISNIALKAYIPVIIKLHARGNVRDGDLCSCAPLGLFVLAYERVETKELGDALADIAQTCVQGDSHRLFALLLAHHRSEQGLPMVQEPKAIMTPIVDNEWAVAPRPAAREAGAVAQAMGVVVKVDSVVKQPFIAERKKETPAVCCAAKKSTVPATSVIVEPTNIKPFVNTFRFVKTLPIPSKAGAVLTRAVPISVADVSMDTQQSVDCCPKQDYADPLPSTSKLIQPDTQASMEVPPPKTPMCMMKPPHFLCS